MRPERGHTEEPFVPALRFRWLTALYDPLLRWTLRAGAFERALTSLVLHHLARLGAPRWPESLCPCAPGVAAAGDLQQVAGFDTPARAE